VASYTFPEQAELIQIRQDYVADLTREDEVFGLFPITPTDAHILKWEQRDNYLGLQQIRGLNGEPPKVKRVGHKQYQMIPGIYGEFGEADELELTTRRQIGTWGEPIKLDDIISEIEEQLTKREIDRIRLIIWTLLATGTFSVSNVQGSVTYTDTYPIQTFTAGVTWATAATATPLANFRSVQLLSRGHSVSFGSQAQAFMNRTTFNQMISNTNNADIAGRRVSGLLTVLNLEEVNKVLAGEDLPTIVIYDKGYYDDSATFQLFIPNGKVIVFGQRPDGDVVGEYRQTRNVNNPDMGPGSYTLIEDSLNNQKPPRRIRVHQGHNGGCALFYPSAVVAMAV
jgi:hypothetical protein